MKHSYNYFYKITNLINDHYYYGVHSTSNLDDGYMGSGKRIQYAIKKYGIENFKKDILKFFDTSEEAYNYEAEVVTEQLVKSKECYNLKLGGSGGWMPQVQLTAETKLKISKANKENHLGKLNANYGNKWIHNKTLKQSKCVSQNDLPIYLNNGWELGRILNFDKFINAQQEKQTRLSKKEKAHQEFVDTIRAMYNDYKKVGIKEAMRLHNYKQTYVNLIGLFKKYIPEYTPNVCNRWKNKQ